MANIKKFNLSGEEIGHFTLSDELLNQQANSQMIKDYIVALRANLRQWSAHTKTRAEVSHSGQKPHPQKGTGRARQGYLGAAQYKGGGRVGGPRAKLDFHIAINRKEKRAAIRHLLAEKVHSDRMVALDADVMNAPKTKAIADFLKSLRVFGRKILFVADKLEFETNSHFVRSMRNIPNAQIMLLENVSGYDVVSHGHIVVLNTATNSLTQMLEG
ncbi:MAG: 50S ribosomal protein L4 [Candidatus Rhabdochlamydia sp.]